MRPIDHIVVHCSASQPYPSIDAAVIRRWHRDRGFLDIGYHYVIKTDGTVEPGRPLDKVGAHVEGHNATSIGICLVGGVDAKGKSKDNFEPVQKETLKTLIYQLLCQFPGSVVLGHRDFPNVHKDCPCFDVRQWMKGVGLGNTDDTGGHS